MEPQQPHKERGDPWLRMLQEWTTIADFLLAEGWERLHVSTSPDFKTAFSACFAFMNFGTKSRSEEVYARLGDCDNSIDPVCIAASKAFSVNISVHRVVEHAAGHAAPFQVDSTPFGQLPAAPTFHFLMDLEGRLSCLVRHDDPPAPWDSDRLLRAKKRLLHIKRGISDAISAAVGNFQWMEKYFAHLQGLSQQAEAALVKAQTAPIIGVVGGSRLGKSALLNVLLQCNLLPAEAGEITTAVATSISFADTDGFRCTFDLESRASIKRMLENYKQCLNILGNLKKRKDAPAPDGDVEDVLPVDPKAEIEKITKELDQHKGRLSALMGSQHLLDSLASGHASKEAMARWNTVLSTAQNNQQKLLEVPHISLLGEIVRPFLSAVQMNWDKEAVPLWPLVRHAHISGNFSLLASGAVLLDLPGVSDKNAARRDLAARYLTQCSHVLLVGNAANPQDNSFSDILKTISDVNRDLLRNITVVIPQCISKVNLAELRSVWEIHTSSNPKQSSTLEKCRMHIVTRIGKFRDVLEAAGFPECAHAPVVAVDAFSAAYLENLLEDIVGAEYAEDLGNLVQRVKNPRECQIASLRKFIQLSSANRTWYMADLEAQLDQLFHEAVELAKSGPSTLLERNEKTLSIFQRFSEFVIKQQEESFLAISALLNDFASKTSSSAQAAPNLTRGFFLRERQSSYWNTFLAHASRYGEFYTNWNRGLLEHFSSVTGSASVDITRSQAVAAIFQSMSSAIKLFEEDCNLAGVPAPVIAATVASLERQRELCRDSIIPATSNAKIMETLKSIATPCYTQICYVSPGRGRFDRMINASLSLADVHQQLLHHILREISEIEHSCHHVLRAFGAFAISSFERLFDSVSEALRCQFVSSGVTTRFAVEIGRNSDDYVLDQEFEDILGRLAQVHVIGNNRLNNGEDDIDDGDVLGLPYHFQCPISLQLMLWPIKANDGRVYDAATLVELLATEGPVRSPLNSDVILDPTQFKLDAELLESIKLWLESDRGRAFLLTDEGEEFGSQRAKMPHSPF